MEPSAARLYAYWLGAAGHLAADREVADRISAIAPCVVPAARANRGFVSRAVTSMARQGVTQFLDLGCGLPAGQAVHEIARWTVPDARVVYVDHDDQVVAGARAEWGGEPGVLACRGDAREPSRLIKHPQVLAHLDPSRPIGVLLTAVLHSLDDEEAATTLAQLRAVLAPGSLLALTHLTLPALPPGSDPGTPPGRHEHALAAAREAARLHEALAGPCRLRTPDEVTRLLDGWPLLEPGLTGAAGWRRLPGRPPQQVPVLAGIGRREPR
jgi:SAM-dependent methyltransferase